MNYPAAWFGTVQRATRSEGTKAATKPHAMIDRPRHNERAPESEAEAISRASDQEVREYVRRGIMQRWLSRGAFPQLARGPAGDA